MWKWLVDLLKEQGALRPEPRSGWVSLDKAKLPVHLRAYFRGLYAPEPVVDTIKEFSRIPSEAERFYTKWLLGPWKFSRVVARPSTHIRNIMSNLILNDVGGLPFWRVDIYTKALRDYIRKGEWFKLARKHGVLSPTFYREELEEILDAWISSGEDVWSKLKNVVSRVGERMGRVYEAEEQWFKLAKFVHNVSERGMPLKEAARDAVECTFDYSKIPASVRFIRTWAAPFFTFTYKAIPYLAKKAIENPVAVMKWPFFFTLATQYALEKTGLSEEEWQYVRDMLPEYYRKGIWLLLPWRDRKGRLQLLDLTYIAPWGDIAELRERGVLGFIQNPYLTTFAQLKYNRKYDVGGSEVPIWNELLDPPEVKLAKALSQVWTNLMPLPSYMPGGWDWRMFARAVEESAPEVYKPTSTQLALRQVGLRILPVERATLRKYPKTIFRRWRKELHTELRKARTPEERARALRKAIERWREVHEIYPGVPR